MKSASIEGFKKRNIKRNIQSSCTTSRDLMISNKDFIAPMTTRNDPVYNPFIHPAKYSDTLSIKSISD